MNIFKKLLERKSTSRGQTTFCFCPECKNELVGSNSLVGVEELVSYRCSCCLHVSEWLFDAPVPILIDDLIRAQSK